MPQNESNYNSRKITSTTEVVIADHNLHVFGILMIEEKNTIHFDLNILEKVIEISIIEIFTKNLRVFRAFVAPFRIAKIETGKEKFLLLIEIEDQLRTKKTTSK